MIARTLLRMMIRTAYVMVVCLTIGVWPTLASADLGQQTDFRIPAQRLPLALLKFAAQSGVQVTSPGRLAEGKNSAGVMGKFEARDALGKLLEGTDLQFDVVDENTVLIVARRGKGAAATSGSNEGEAGSAARLAQASAADPGSSSDGRSSAENLNATDAQGSSGNEKLEEIIVTAQKREESLQKVPISISVLSGAQLESPNIGSASAALATVPGVAINQSYNGSGTVVTIRGVAVGQALFAGSSPVAYYLDSVPFGLVKSAIAPDEDVYDLQRIEVLRGPQGTLYGASALNGVVRVLTNDADLNNFDVKVRSADSYTDGGGNNYRGDMAVNAPLIDGKLAGRAVVGYENDSGWIDTPVKNGVNDAEQKNYRLKLNAKPIDDLTIGLSYWGARDHSGAPPTGDENYRNSALLNQPIQTDFDAYGLKLGYALAGYSLSSATSYLKYRNDANLDLSSLAGLPLGLYTALDSSVFSQELLLNSPSNGVWRWSVGAMYRRATEDLYQYYSMFGPTALDAVTGFVEAADDTSESYAGYGEITRLFLDGRLELTAGLRQFEDHVTQRGRLALTDPLVHTNGNFSATTPRVVLAWHTSDYLMLYGSYSQGFRSGFPQDPSVPAAFPPTKADTLYNYESGAKGSLWGGRLSFDAAVYYMDWRHVQQLLAVPFEDVSTTAVINGQSASGEGVDLSITAQPISGLTFGMYVSWNNLEMDSAVYSDGAVLFQKGDRLTMSPETTAGASAAYLMPLGDTGLIGRLSTSINYTSAQRYTVSLGGPDILVGIGDPVAIGNVGVSIESSDHWSATLFVHNVNDERGAVIRPYQSPDLTSRILPRTAGLQLEYHFR